MEKKKDKLKGATTDFLFFWDPLHGWIHISETEKLKGSYERFKKMDIVDFAKNMLGIQLFPEQEKLLRQMADASMKGKKFVISTKTTAKSTFTEIFDEYKKFREGLNRADSTK